MSFKRKTLCDECSASPGLSIKTRRRLVSAIRDFPINCGPPTRFSSDMLKSSNQFELQDSNDDLKSADKSIVPYDPDTKVELQGAFDNARLLSPLKISVCETNKLRNKVQQITAKGYPPQRRISAIRSFPPGCGRKTQVHQEFGPELIVSKTSGLDHNLPEVEGTRDSKHQNNVKIAGGDSYIFCSYSKLPGIKKGKVQENNKNECLNRKLSGQNSVNSSQKMVSSTELPGQRVIVQALMAAPNCPWRQSKRVGKNKLNKHSTRSFLLM